MVKAAVGKRPAYRRYEEQNQGCEVEDAVNIISEEMKDVDVTSEMLAAALDIVRRRNADLLDTTHPHRLDNMIREIYVAMRRANDAMHDGDPDGPRERCRWR